MKCPYCGKEENEVLESRVIENGSGIRRRRSCQKCHKRFTTVERVREKTIWVIKKDGRREQFDIEKIRKGVLRAVQKRPVSLELVNDIVGRVDREILKKYSQEVSSNVIGRAVLKKLQRVDKVAWLRYASVYFEFEDLKDFEKLIYKNTEHKNG